MITLTYSVIAHLHARPGDEDLRLLGDRRHQQLHPGWIGNILDHPNRLYYIALGVAIVVYVAHPLPRADAVRALAPGRPRRADPRRRSLGYNVPLHRTLAFGFAAFLAGLAGVLYAWCRGAGRARRRRPAADDQPADHGRDRRSRQDRGRLGRRVRLLRDAELHHHDTHIPLLGFGGTLFGGSFNTIIGIIFLAIVVVSPDGLLGHLGSAVRHPAVARRGSRRPAPAQRSSPRHDRMHRTRLASWVATARESRHTFEYQEGGGHHQMRRLTLRSWKTAAVLVVIARLP